MVKIYLKETILKKYIIKCDEHMPIKLKFSNLCIFFATVLSRSSTSRPARSPPNNAVCPSPNGFGMDVSEFL